MTLWDWRLTTSGSGSIAIGPDFAKRIQSSKSWLVSKLSSYPPTSLNAESRNIADECANGLWR
jgi:hypothetical protein